MAGAIVVVVVVVVFTNVFGVSFVEFGNVFCCCWCFCCRCCR